jgi:hypothetical protein
MLDLNSPFTHSKMRAIWMCAEMKANAEITGGKPPLLRAEWNLFAAYVQKICIRRGRPEPASYSKNPASVAGSGAFTEVCGRDQAE